MQDKEIAGDILDLAKHQSLGYVRGALECSNANLRNTMLEFAEECLEDHWRIYRLAEQRGWYLPSGPTDNQEMTRIRQHFQTAIQNISGQPVGTR